MVQEKDNSKKNGFVVGHGSSGGTWPGERPLCKGEWWDPREKAVRGGKRFNNKGCHIRVLDMQPDDSWTNGTSKQLGRRKNWAEMPEQPFFCLLRNGGC